MCIRDRSRVFCNSTLMGAIIQETGGPLREERAVDGKLKSRLEWPKLYCVQSISLAFERVRECVRCA